MLVKRLSGIIIFLVISLNIISCREELNEANNFSPEGKVKKWTYLFYSTADAYDLRNQFEQFAERVSSDDNVNYLVLNDTKEDGGVYYYVDSSSRVQKLAELGETNMADGNTLKNFIKYSQEHFPAERIILAFYSHGVAWKGTCLDHDDILTFPEIEKALSSADNIELVMFTAPCFMSTIEGMYQLKDRANYYIASEDTSGFIHWRGMLAEFNTYLKNNPDVTGERLSKEIISLHKKNLNERFGHMLTLTAVDLSRITDFITSFNDVLQFYIDHPAELDERDYTKIQRIDRIGADLYNYLYKLYVNETDKNQEERIQLALENFDNMIVSFFARADMPDYKGININFPDYMVFTRSYFNSDSDALIFTKETKWTDFLKVVNDKKYKSVE